MENRICSRIAINIQDTLFVTQHVPRYDAVVHCLSLARQLSEVTSVSNPATTLVGFHVLVLHLYILQDEEFLGVTGGLAPCSGASACLQRF